MSVPATSAIGTGACIRWALRLPNGSLVRSDNPRLQMGQPAIYHSRERARKGARELCGLGAARPVRIEVTAGWRVLG